MYYRTDINHINWISCTIYVMNVHIIIIYLYIYIYNGDWSWMFLFFIGWVVKLQEPRLVPSAAATPGLGSWKLWVINSNVVLFQDDDIPKWSNMAFYFGGNGDRPSDGICFHHPKLSTTKLAPARRNGEIMWNLHHDRRKTQKHCDFNEVDQCFP